MALFKTDHLGRHFIREWMESRTRADGSKWVPDDVAEAVEHATGATISGQTIRRICDIEQPYSQYQLEALAQVFGCQPWDLLTGPPPDPVPEEDEWKTGIFKLKLSKAQGEAVLHVARQMGGGDSSASLNDNFVTPKDTSTS